MNTSPSHFIEQHQPKIEQHQPKRERIPALDGLRGMAALLVVLSHLSSRKIFLLPGLNLVGLGKSGVYLFFVLSAFLLTVPFLTGFEYSWKSLSIYIQKRFFRIYPLYFIFLSVAFISSSGLLGGVKLKLPYYLNFSEYLRHLLLFEGMGVAWTIPVEAFYYLLLPIFAYILSDILKSRVIPSIILLCILIVTITNLSQLYFSGNHPVIYVPLFLMGSTLSLLYVNRTKRISRFSSQCLELLGAVSLFSIFSLTPIFTSMILGYEVERTTFFDEHILFGLLWCFVVASCAFYRGYVCRFFELNFLRYLGKISFSMYLIHMTVIIFIDNLPVLESLKAIFSIVITIGLSHLSYHYVEKKLIR